MPSDQSTWLVAAPETGDTEGLFDELTTKLSGSSKAVLPLNISQLAIPSFKTGTLESLVTISEGLPKQDAFFTATVAKTVDTLRNLLNNDSSKMSQHILVNEQPVDTYLFKGWSWNEGRYGVHRGVREMLEVLNKEMMSIDNVMKQKLNSYNLAKGSLTQMQRKRTGNLSVRSLVDVVKAEHFISDSEYLQTVIVAVPKNNVKDWNSKYERLTPMVVPRSSTLIASDDEYNLYAVVVFKRVHDDFVQKCREDKFMVRDFEFSEDAMARQREELQQADLTEKELWTELLQVSRTNFSEAFQILAHLKVLELFIESVLRYGLPAHYVGFLIKPESKMTKRTLSTLQSQFAYLGRRSGTAKGSASGAGATEDFGGEYATLLEQEYFDFRSLRDPLDCALSPSTETHDMTRTAPITMHDAAADARRREASART